jgi:dihydroorotase
MHQVLHFEDITSASIGAADDHNLHKLSNRMLNQLQSLKSSLTFVLLTHEEQSQADSEIFSKVFVELSFISFHHGLDDSFSNVSIALSHKTETQSQGSV